MKDLNKNNFPLLMAIFIILINIQGKLIKLITFDFLNIPLVLLPLIIYLVMKYRHESYFKIFQVISVYCITIIVLLRLSSLIIHFLIDDDDLWSSFFTPCIHLAIYYNIFYLFIYPKITSQRREILFYSILFNVISFIAVYSSIVAVVKYEYMYFSVFPIIITVIILIIYYFYGIISKKMDRVFIGRSLVAFISLVLFCMYILYAVKSISNIYPIN